MIGKKKCQPPGLEPVTSAYGMTYTLTIALIKIGTDQKLLQTRTFIHTE